MPREILNMLKLGKDERKRVKRELKAEILEILAREKFTNRKKLCARVGIQAHTFINWMKEDQMFGHHVIKLGG